MCNAYDQILLLRHEMDHWSPILRGIGILSGPPIYIFMSQSLASISSSGPDTDLKTCTEVVYFPKTSSVLGYTEYQCKIS